jgi:hypothetical protein
MAHPTVPSLTGHRHVFELDAASGARANVWHTDVTFVERPPSASILNAVVIPPVGGDTMWANTEAAYDALPDHLRTLADGLWVRHSNQADYAGMTTAGRSYTSAFHSASFVARHPPVRVHPVSGRRSLLLGGFANSLELGCDCVGEIFYFDGVVNDQDGEPATIENAICMHEEDYGIGWKHTDFRTEDVEVRRLRRLVISSIATVGNYEYGYFWYLYTDGTIEYEVKLTGVISTVRRSSYSS